MENRSCQNCHMDFTIEPDDFSFYEKIQVPPPTFCPACRLQRRLAFKNERSLHKRACDFSGENIVSLYPSGMPFPVYHQKYWWSDDWDPMSYGQEIDWSRPIMEQIQELRLKVPRVNLIGLYKTLENSDYINMSHNCKNCYLVFNADYDERCLYGSEIESSTDCINNLMIDSCTLCYECINCNKCYRTFFSEDCNECADVWFSKDCTGCSDCFGCINLRKKKYCIFNEQYSKEEYEARIKEYNLQSRFSLLGWQNKAEKFWLEKGIHKYMHGVQNEKVSGEYINNSKNVRDSFIVRGSKDCRYCMMLIVGNNEDCYDYIQFGENTERMYEVMQGGNSTQDVKFSWLVVSSSHIEYSDCLYSCTNCFGCVGLRNKEYCIFNKQYSKEEYNKLLPEIKKNMIDMPYVDAKKRVYPYGEFFPVEFSFIPYNQSSAQDYFPLTETEVKNNSYIWNEIESGEYTITLTADKIPDTIEEVSDSITNEIVACNETGKAFRIVADELLLHRTLGLPLPHCCPEVRQKRRTMRRRVPALFDRICTRCGDTIQSSFSADRAEIVYCESCYQKEVI